VAIAAIVTDERVRALFCWIAASFSGDERYADLSDAFAAVFGDLWGLAEEDEYEYRRLQALLDDAIASGPADDDEPVGPRESQPYRVRASLGAMGAGQWTGQYRTRPHALLDVRQFSSVDEWASGLRRGARRTLAKARSDEGGFTATVRGIRGGEPAPHSSHAHFRVVVAHEVRLLASEPDDVLSALSTAVGRYMGTTRMAGEVREYRDARSGKVIAFAHEITKGRVVRGQWFYADAAAARRFVWFHAVHDLVRRAIADNDIDVVDLGPSGSDAFSELKSKFGFVSVRDWCDVADYRGPFRFGADERPGDKLVGWLAGVLY